MAAPLEDADWLAEFFNVNRRRAWQLMRDEVVRPKRGLIPSPSR
jgi:hypothetical protein